MKMPRSRDPMGENTKSKKRRGGTRDEREEEGLLPGSIWSRVWSTGVEGFNRERGIWTLWTLGDEIGIVVG